MHRIDGPNATPAGLWQQGDPILGTPSTITTAPWQNDVQEELTTVIESEGITLVKGQQDQLYTAITGLVTPVGFRNPIINPGMRLWQRGTSFTLNGAAQNRYTADRWYSSAGDGVCVVSRIATTLGQALLPEGTRNALRHAQNTAASGFNPWQQQRIEGVRRFAGQTVNVSFYARVQSGTLLCTPEIIQFFGTGGAPSPSVQTTGANVQLTTTWTRFNVTISVPSIVGKTLGLDGNDWVNVRLTFPSGATFVVDLVWVELSVGNKPRRVEHRPEGIELVLAQRFYQKSYDRRHPPGSIIRVGVVAAHEEGTLAQGLQTRLPVRMRAVPTVVWYSPISGQAGTIEWWTGGVQQSHAVTAQLDAGESSTGYPEAASHTGGTSDQLYAHYTCSAEL